MKDKKQFSLVGNAGDEDQVKKADEKIKLRRDTEIADIKQILNTGEGRRFIWRYLGICGIDRISYRGNSETDFNEGQRNIGLKLKADIIDADIHGYIKMEYEQLQGDE